MLAKTILLTQASKWIENIVLNINMDMIAHNDSLELFASGLYHYPALKQPLDNLRATKIKLLYGHDDPNEKDVEDWTNSSDHRQFHERQIPFIYFGVEDHEDFHMSTDTYEKINQEFYVEAVQLIIEAIEGYDSSNASIKVISFNNWLSSYNRFWFRYDYCGNLFM